MKILARMAEIFTTTNNFTKYLTVIRNESFAILTLDINKFDSMRRVRENQKRKKTMEKIKQRDTNYDLNIRNVHCVELH